MIALKDKYRDYFKVGSCVNRRTIKNCEDLIKTHFNSLTCENETKFISVCTDKDNYNFTRADKIVEFARKNNILLRGHTLVWHNQTPNFIFKTKSKEDALEALRTHITLLDRRYHDDMYCWDVVNEAIEDKTDKYLRETKWKATVGDDYMDYAFTIAKEIMPDKQLFYNDYNEIEEPKISKIIKAVSDLKDRGIPIDGVGLQCHLHYDDAGRMDVLKRAIERYAALGLRLHVTEMDVSLYNHEEETHLSKPDPKRLELQAEVYGESFKIFREYKDYIDCVTIWGIADDYTWLDNFPVWNRKNWPLLFDENHEPKEAFYRITDF